MVFTDIDPHYGRPRTVAEAAGELNLSPATVRAWIFQRRIGVTRLGRAVRVPESEIRRLLTAGFQAASR